MCVCASLFRRMMMDILVLLVSKERETQKRRARAGPRPATTTEERLAGWLAGWPHHCVIDAGHQTRASSI